MEQMCGRTPSLRGLAPQGPGSRHRGQDPGKSPKSDFPPLCTPNPPPCNLAEVQLGPPQVDVDISSLGSTVQILTIYQ